MPRRRYAVVYQAADANAGAMATIQAAVAMFAGDRYAYNAPGLDITRPPRGVYDYIAFFGGHGDVNAGAPADLLGNPVAAWDVWVAAVAGNGVRAKHIILDCCFSAAFIRTFTPLLATAEMPHLFCTITCSISSSYGTLAIRSGRTLGETVAAKMQDEWNLVGPRVTKYRFAPAAVVPPLLAQCDIGDDTELTDAGGVWQVGDYTTFFLANAYGVNFALLNQEIATAIATAVLVVVPGGSQARFFPRAVYATQSQVAGTLYRCGGFLSPADEEVAFRQWEGQGGGGGGDYAELTGMMTYLEARGITITRCASVSQLKNAADLNIRVVG